MKNTRREFLKALGLGATAIAMPACGRIASMYAGNRPFTFAQICDTQLGMGGYDRQLLSVSWFVRLPSQ